MKGQIICGLDGNQIVNSESLALTIFVVTDRMGLVNTHKNNATSRRLSCSGCVTLHNYLCHQSVTAGSAEALAMQ
jgi:hypothetical protein